MRRVGSVIFLGVVVGMAVEIAGLAAEILERQKPWLARGTVTDVHGKPVEGAEIIAHCGMGTLLPTGRAVTGADGSYGLNFGPGFLSREKSLVQAATISVHKSGCFETNLHRQGDLIATFEIPEGGVRWGKKTVRDLFLPNRPRKIDFVLAPAGSVSGVVRTASGKPLGNKRIGLTGDVLPPSSSVIAEKKTDADGRFDFKDVPTGYKWKLYVEDGRKDWRNWPSAIVKLDKPAPHEFSLQIQGDQLEVKEIAN